MPPLELMYAIFAVFVVALIFFVYRAWTKIKLAQAVETWEQLQGVVTNANVDKRYIEKSDGERETKYTFDIQYRYEVNGSEYFGNKISPAGHAVSNQMEALAMQARYVASPDVTVYVDPENPEEAYLEGGVTPRVLYRTIIPVVVCVAFLIIIPLFIYFDSVGIG